MNRSRQPPREASRPPADEADSVDAAQARIHELFRQLPPEIGLLLIGGGVVGLLLPLVPGIPLLVAGGLVLSPKSADRLDDWMKHHFPTLHDVALAQLERFVDDFRRRYPPGTP